MYSKEKLMKKIKLSVLTLALIGGLLLTGCKNKNDSTDPSSVEESSSGSETTEVSSSSLETHTITFDSHGGSLVPYQVVEHGSKITKPQDPIKLGYEFVNWTYKGDEWSFVDFIVTEDMTLDANWNIVNYSITYNLNGGINNEQNPTTYTVEDSVTLYEPTRVGYTFDGWFDDENNRITHLGQTIVGNFTLTARWSANLNNLSIASSDETKGTVTIVSGSGYSDETIIVEATPKANCVFAGWYHESTIVSNDATYTFTMPTNDYSLVAHFFTKAEEEKYAIKPIISNGGKTVTYGLYPQTNVNDSALISALNTLTTPESNGWYLYGGDYYAKLSAAPCDSNYVFDNGTTIVEGTTYWFKCEPITWNVLSNNNGEYYLLSSVLLDAHRYNEYYLGGQNGHYANNYEYSEIRSWLNNDFYNSAFALGSDHILTTTVDNSASTTNSDSNSYVCNNTQDKIFLPSYKDYINSNYGFSTLTSSDNTRYCKTTDWARARGAYYYTSSGAYQYNGYYWTRSPSSYYSYYAWDPDFDGGLDYDYVDFTSGSVRPGLSITIA